MAKDVARRFMLENADTRGEWVHLDDAWQEMLKRADYPAIIRKVLGEALAASVLLSATIKHKGSMIMQIRGDGPVHLLVIQATPDGQVRGLANWSTEPQESSLSAVFGKANIVITLEAENDNERYQGIIELKGDKLSDALENYFLQSEQLPTRLWLYSDEQTSAGILLQRLPASEQSDEDWARVGMLLDTLTADELAGVEPEELIFRLFHEETPRLFDARELKFQCSCSQAKIESTVKGLGEAEARSIIAEQGKIEVNCQFCNSRYVMDDIDVTRLFAGVQAGPTSSTLH
ncbi:MAG: Hsp33 family molecular chaperone HslO [Thiolinea sp.]